MVKDKYGYYGLCLVFMLTLIAVINSRALAAERLISYLPRNEDMQNKAIDYGATPNRLLPLACAQGADLFNLVTRCNYCVLDLQKNCPKCCLNLSTSPFLREIKCSSGFSCKAAPFYGTDCTALQCPGACLNKSDCNLSGIPIPIRGGYIDWYTVCQNSSNMSSLNHCQQYGCPNAEPNGSCTYNAMGGYWRCDNNNYLPKQRGCPSHVGAVTSPYSLSNSPSTYYDIVTDFDCYPNPSPPPDTICTPYYKYTPRSGFVTAINNCRAYTYTNADNPETCTNSQHCCKRAVCTDVYGWPPAPNTATPTASTPNDFIGYNDHCDETACQARVAFPECQNPASPDYAMCCDNLTTQTCADLNKDATECLLEGGCVDCFQQIDTNWSYRFVARSRQAATIIWQIATDPNYIAGAPTYLYTRVRVYKINPTSGAETLIHESIPHQKSLEAAFSVYCATHIPAGMLEQGEPYIVKVFYFLPEIKDEWGIPMTDLYVDINSMQLIVITTRE